MLEGLKAEVEKLRDVDPAALRDPATIVELNRLMASLDAINTRATAAFDTAREWEASGSRTAGAWLRSACRLPIATARRRVRLGRALRHLPAAEQAWLEGDISDSHVLALEGVRTEKTEEQLARDEKMLVDDARILNFSHFIMVLSYWAQHADPDGTEEKAKDNLERRNVQLSQSLEGMWFGDMILDPITGEIVSNELRRRERELFEADWAEARERLGDKVTVNDLRRTPVSAELTRWRRWRDDRQPLPPMDASPSRCSPCWWATRR